MEISSANYSAHYSALSAVDFDDIGLPSIAFFVAYVGTSQLYACLDLWNPPWYQRRACAPNLGAMSNKIYLQLLVINLRNLFFAFAIFSAASYLRGTMIHPPLSILNATFQMMGCYMFGEIWFYVVHRCSHAFSWTCHNKHHEFSNQVYAMVGFYSSLLEMFIINIPIGLGFALSYGVHPFVLAVWLALLGFHIANNHSGHWLFPKWIDDPSHHLRHHKFHTVNYGATWVHQTCHFIQNLAK